MIDTIVNSFDIWTDAQGIKSRTRINSVENISLQGISRLRELIFELAIQGKLLPQNPNDEPAINSFEKLAIEKKQLIEQKLLKKQVSLSPIKNDEKYFDLPKSWEWIKLGDITADIHYGYTASANTKSNGIRLLRITDIQDDDVNWETVPGCDIDEAKAINYLLENGDVLIARTGGTIGKSYLVKNISVKSVFASYLIRIKKLPSTYSEFIKLYLKSLVYWKQLYESSMGTGQPNVNGIALKNLKVPFAPHAEQRRIVAKVNELMDLCDKLEAEQFNNLKTHQILVKTLLETLTQAADADELQVAWERMSAHFDTLFCTEDSIEQLKQTILQLAVMGKLVRQDPNDEPVHEFLRKIEEEKEKLIHDGKIKKQDSLQEIKDERSVELPKGWIISRLGTFTIVGTGGTPSRERLDYYYPSEVNWVTSGETSQDFINETNEKISLRALKETNVTIYPKGSLIIAMYGQGKTRGQVSELMIDAGTNQACAAIVLVNKDESHRKYLKYFFKKAYEELRSHSAGGAQPNLNLGKVSNTVIPIPPIQEQDRIVSKVDELFILCDSLKDKIRKSQSLKVSLSKTIVEKAVL